MEEEKIEKAILDLLGMELNILVRRIDKVQELMCNPLFNEIVYRYYPEELKMLEFYGVEF